MTNKTYRGKITAQGTEIAVLSHGSDDDYISLTDIARYKTPSTRAMSFKTGCAAVTQLNLLGFGKEFITLISITSNSR